MHSCSVWGGRLAQPIVGSYGSIFSADYLQLSPILSILKAYIWLLFRGTDTYELSNITQSIMEE